MKEGDEDGTASPLATTHPAYAKDWRLALPDAVIRLPDRIGTFLRRGTKSPLGLLAIFVAGGVGKEFVTGIIGNSGDRWWVDFGAPLFFGTLVLPFGFTLLYLFCATALAVAYFMTSLKRGILLTERAMGREDYLQALSDRDQKIGRLLAEVDPERRANKLRNAQVLHSQLLLILESLRSATDGKRLRVWWRLLESMFEGLAVVFEKGLVDRGSLLVPCGDGEYLRICRGSRVHRNSILARRFYYGNATDRLDQRGVSGTVYAAGEPKHVQDIAMSEFALPLGDRPPAYRSMLAVPVGNAQPLLGVLSIESNDDAFEPDLDIYILRTFADLLASGLRVLEATGVSRESLLLNLSDDDAQ